MPNAERNGLGALAAKCSTLKLDLERTPSGSILWLTLNRPQAFNAISMECLHELHRVLDALQHPTTMHEPLPADHPRVLIIRAAGRAFSGGVDIKAADRGMGGRSWDYKDMRSQQALSRLIEKFRQIPQPIVCAVQGPAAGAGLSIALASDVRIAGPAASFSAAFVRLGLTGTDMGTSFFLPKIVGSGLASEMLLTGRDISAERAYQQGLVNELVSSKEEESLHAAARRMAEDMLACSIRGLQLTKEQMNATAEGGSLRSALVAENSHQMLLVNDPVTAAAAQAWLNTIMKRGSTARSKL